MKNHIIFKFIAILLCAVSLLGIAGSAVGIFVLTEMDLYNKTVDQVKESRIQEDGAIFANEAALRYASQTLGGCPEEFVDNRYDVNWFYNVYDAGKFSYALLDAEGNTVYSSGEPQAEAAMYTFPVSGQYLYMVSKESQSEMEARQQAEAASFSANLVIGETYEVTNSLPTEGKLISYAVFYDPTGMILYEVFNAENGVGYLYYGQDGNVTFSGFASEYRQSLGNSTVAGVIFYDLLDTVVYEASSMEGVGTVSFNSLGQMIFTASEPQPEPEPTAAIETLPEETAAETAETAAEETTAEEESDEETIEETSAKEESKHEDKKSEEQEAAEETTAATAAPTEPAPTEPEPTVAPTVPEETAAPTEPLLINGKPLDEFQVEKDGYFDSALGEPVSVSYVYTPMPEYTVALYLEPGAQRSDSLYDLLRIVQYFRSYLLPALGICLLAFAIFAVYLCCAAGRKPKSEEVRAGGLNRMPLDMYFALAFSGFALMVGLGMLSVEELLQQNILTCCLFVALAAFGASLLIVGFCFAFVAQIKTPDGFWWRNSLCGRCIRIFARFAVWLDHVLTTKCFPALGRLFKALWQFTCKAVAGLFHLWEKFASWLIGKFRRFFSLLPVTWQWLLTGCVMIFILALTTNSYNGLVVLIGLVLTLGIILYGAHSFGTLAESAKRMSKGDLDTKVDNRLMIGCFEEFASDLNDLADVAVVAAQKQLKSERMKTELITNVSHDIKTPLTSIINYVDLLQKPHNEEQEAQYLEVLSRQSLRLKKLIEDLMEMSKASTGNMAVEVTIVDAVESVNQALGEFADKLSAAQLTPVFRHTEESVAMMADGKLVWRVMSNILSNAVKYAMPGTRLYIDLMELEGKVVISLKNISREELNVDADELMERFVRGDDSRNTEGSGLGLNIAKSLMELQKGQMQLLVDGDLFKVTLIFPGV